jgi:hypothetical protein
MQRWKIGQHELIPYISEKIGQLTQRLAKLIYILECVRIEEWTDVSWRGIGRPLIERAWVGQILCFLDRCLILVGTLGLIAGLKNDRSRLQMCGFPRCKRRPPEATFPHVFDEFFKGKLAE